jgi:hypothetical protein
MTMAVQFVTIFLGAFLAFGLENYREQRRTRRWVYAYLDHLLADLEPALSQGRTVRDELDATIAAAAAWQQAGRPSGPDELDEPSWDRLAEVPTSSAIDLSPVLRTEAITALPNQLALALADVERAGRLLELSTAQLIGQHERDVLPLWYQRKIPLSPEEARRVAWFQTSVASLARITEEALLAVRYYLVSYRGQNGHQPVAGRRSGDAA